MTSYEYKRKKHKRYCINCIDGGDPYETDICSFDNTFDNIEEAKKILYKAVHDDIKACRYMWYDIVDCKTDEIIYKFRAKTYKKFTRNNIEKTIKIFKTAHPENSFFMDYCNFLQSLLPA